MRAGHQLARLSTRSTTQYGAGWSPVLQETFKDSFSDQKNRHRPDHPDIDNVRAPCCVG